MDEVLIEFMYIALSLAVLSHELYCIYFRIV